ncbi:glycosyltransferase 87 family protein [Asanoa sp. NPDC050611]|uniref:glycosyltransferase 87 family protein n=1 Tax=Asanoa sp. NPDC050611 TaxID=3157098 RepID=UPI0033F35FF1
MITWSRLDRAAGGLAFDLGLYAVSAGFAAITAATSTLLPHRAWGAVAAWGYAAAAVAVLVQWLAGNRDPRVRAAIVGVAWVATAWLPMLIQSVERAGGRTDRAQEEVLVVEDGGGRLLHHGTPYLSDDTIARLPVDERLLGYLPYQPGMSLFGLPRAVAGDAWWTDARVWFLLVTTAALALAVALVRGPRVLRAVQLTTVLPVCALTVATGGDDLPVLALCLLSLALCARSRWGWAGVAAGLAGALKLFALPIVAVLLIHALTRRRFGRFALGAIGLPVLAVVPPLMRDPGALVDNVIGFPLGHGVVTSPAASPFPGHLIASGLPGGRLIAAGLLGLAGVVIAVWLVRRPPRTAAAAALFSGYGLLAAILLMPATRFGYLLYPVALLAWAAALRMSAGPEAPRDRVEEETGGRATAYT